MDELNSKINSYLWFGYLPQVQFPDWLDNLTQSSGMKYSRKEAIRCIDQIFDRLLHNNHGTRHIIPLSGGWDSRTILGFLLDRLETSQIEAITFGEPGQLDFDLGRTIAKSVGIKHHALNLKKVELNWDSIKKSVKDSPWTYTPDGFFNQKLQDSFEDTSIFWSGFLGEALTGKHLLNSYMNSQLCQHEFVLKQKRVDNFILPDSRFKPLTNPLPLNSELHADDLLDLGVRQFNCIAPIVLSGCNINGWQSELTNNKGYKIIAPFADHEFASYWLRAPRELRHKQHFFLEILREKFPYIFQIPGKSNFFEVRHTKLKYRYWNFRHRLIKKIKRRAPNININYRIRNNYIDFDSAFRTRKDYKDTLIASFEFLKKENIVPWIDLNYLWKTHMNKSRRNGEVFQILIGLAANISEKN